MELSGRGGTIAVTSAPVKYTFPSGSQLGRGCLEIGTTASTVYIDWTGANFAAVHATATPEMDKEFLSTTGILGIRIPAECTAFSLACGGSDTATVHYVADARG